MLTPTSYLNTSCKTCSVLTILILSFSLSACAGSSLKTPSPARSRLASSDCEPPEHYAQRALQWTQDARRAEFDRLAESLESSKEYCSVLEFAIFLSTPSSVFQDDSKALLLFKKLDTEQRLSQSEQDYVSRMYPHIQQRQNIRLLLNATRAEVQQLQLQETSN